MKKFISSVVAASVVATAGFSAEISTSGVGDFLIAPAFFAQSAGNGKTFESEIKLVNTSKDTSVVMKGVVRNATASQEVDFGIILTPGDVWVGKIAVDANGKAVLSSDDESNYAKYTKNAQRYDTLNIVLPDFKGLGATEYQSGYLEFYPIIAYDERNQKVVLTTADGSNPAVFGADFESGSYGYKNPAKRYSVTLEAVDKNAVVQRYENLVFGSAIDAKFGIANGTINAVDVPDSIAGQITVTSTATNAAMTIPMLAIKDSAKTNVLLNMTQAANTINYRIAADTQPNLFLDSPAEVMKLLTKSSVNVVYDNGGANNNVLMTFWNDTRNGQARRFAVDVMNNSECMCDCQPAPVVVDCPTCPVPTTAAVAATTPGSPYSGAAVATVPTLATPGSKIYCSYDVFNEFAVVPLKNMIDTTYKCDTNQNWNSGWVRLHSIQQNATTASTALIPTQMSAKNVNGQWSFNWNYLSYAE
jgi:hypothetical protein